MVLPPLKISKSPLCPGGVVETQFAPFVQFPLPAPLQVSVAADALPPKIPPASGATAIASHMHLRARPSPIEPDFAPKVNVDLRRAIFILQNC